MAMGDTAGSSLQRIEHHSGVNDNLMGCAHKISGWPLKGRTIFSMVFISVIFSSVLLGVTVPVAVPVPDGVKYETTVEEK